MKNNIEKVRLGGNKKVGGMSDTIRFNLDDNTHIDIQFSNTGGLLIRSFDPLCISPQVANVLTIGVLK